MGMLIIVKALLTAYVLGNTFIVPRTAITSNVFYVLENLSPSKCLNRFKNYYGWVEKNVFVSKQRQ